LLLLGGMNPAVDVQGELDGQWFERPGVLFPWLIEADGVPAGFALIGNRQLAVAMGVDADFYLHEFHVADGQRRRGLGRAAVEHLRRLHPGSWALVVLAANAQALRFWATALPDSSQEHWTGEEGARYVRFFTKP
jgi:predicted acetyltransferase